jgi:hypothetical protein
MHRPGRRSSRPSGRLSTGLAILLVAGLVGGGCASYDLVHPPARAADVYPDAHGRSGIVVAVDEITQPKRAERYFGADLLQHGIVPVQIVVSNHSKDRIQIKPADILLQHGRQILDPLPLDRVVAIPASKGLFITDGAEESLQKFYEGIAFRETVVAPGDSYQGVLFFQAERPQRKSGSRFFRVVSAYLQPELRLRVLSTNLETRERLGFGPFAVEY